MSTEQRTTAQAGSGVAVSRPGVTLAATCLGLFLGQVDTTAINLALPAMSRDFAGGIAAMQWVVVAYNVAFAALLLTGGTLGDRFGRKRLFGFGVTAFVLGSVVCAVAPTLAVLLAGRVLQGVGSAMILPQSLAILAVTFPGRRERNRAMAAWSVVAGLGLAAGPTLGGLLVSKLDWSYIFWANVPLGALTLLLARRHVPESRNTHARRVDIAGQILGALTLALLTFVVVNGDRMGWLSPAALGCMAATVGCAASFFAVERRHAEPMLPLGLMRRGQLPVATVIAMCMTFGMYGFLTVVSLAFQQQRGVSALVAGLQLLPLPLAFTALSPLVGRLVTRFGPRLPMTAGMLLMGLGLLLYAAVGADASIWAIEASLVVIGIGLALNTGPVVGVAVSAVSPERAGLASGIANLARMFGAALGVAVQATVLAIVSREAMHGAEFVSGVRAAALVGAAVELLGAVLAATMIVNPAAASTKAAPTVR